MPTCTGFLPQAGTRSWLTLAATRTSTERTDAGVTHFVVTILWESVEAIRRFAGDDYLLEREPFATYHEALFAEVQLLSGTK